MTWIKKTNEILEEEYTIKEMQSVDIVKTRKLTKQELLKSKKNIEDLLKLLE